jgi:hypothetical protein
VVICDLDESRRGFPLRPDHKSPITNHKSWGLK